jgi:uncharacterized protein (DUF1684 family)
MKFVATKSVDQLDLQALHRVRERLVSQRTGIMNQIRTHAGKEIWRSGSRWKHQDSVASIVPPIIERGVVDLSFQVPVIELTSQCEPTRTVRLRVFCRFLSI